jgi:hypothetical protein
MANKPKRSRKTSKKRTAAETQAATVEVPAVTPQIGEAPVVEAPAPEPTPALLSVRSAAARCTAEGRFTRVILNQIDGKECPRF